MKQEEKGKAIESKGDFTIPRKRKVDNKETRVTNKIRMRNGRSIDEAVKNEGQIPNAVCSAAALISPLSSVALAKSNRKSATNKPKQNVKVENIAVEPIQCERSAKGEEKKDSILKQIDQSVKDDFHTLGFAKWRKRWLPIVQLSPFDVGPGPVRDEWMKLFRETTVALRLVYWYGSPRDDLSSSFSFLKANAIVGYDEGIARNCHKLTPAMEKKRALGKKLTPAESVLVDGLAEIEGEVSLPKDDRLAWLKM